MQTDCNQFEENKLKLISTPCHSHNFSEQPKQILTETKPKLNTHWFEKT